VSDATRHNVGQAAAILLQNVSFAWAKAERPCLDIEKLEIAAAERVFLHGPSGSGKSTLLSLVGGVCLPQQGSVIVCGERLDRLSAPARDRFRAAQIGFIFQLFNLVPYLSALDNILLPCRFSRERAARIGGAVEGEARRLAKRLELSSELLAKPASTLSVGQQQRVAAARALIGCPPLVIADEPTSALDAGRQKLFLDLLLTESRESGSALLFVSHDERLMDSFDRIVALTAINRATPAGISL